MKVLGSFMTMDFYMFNIYEFDNNIILFRKDYEKYIVGNKLAGRRARKTSLKIERLLLNFRLESINKLHASRTKSIGSSV